MGSCDAHGWAARWVVSPSNTGKVPKSRCSIANSGTAFKDSVHVIVVTLERL